MKNLIVASFFLFYSFHSESMTITRKGSQKTFAARPEYFTGTVMVTPLYSVNEPTPLTGALVTFAPHARSHWHTHPMGQTLIVTKGEGRIQAWGEPVQVIKEGDVIWTPPGQKHWHGGSLTRELTHIAIQESKEGKVVEWMERVTEDQYNKVKK